MSGRGRRAGLVLALAVLAGPAGARAQEGLLARLDVERAAAVLEGARDPAARRDAARFLGRHGAAERATAALASAIVIELHPAVRIEIADALARRGIPAASAAIAERLGGAPRAERQALLRALGAAADPPALAALALELGDPSDGALAADLLVGAGPLAHPAMLEALADPTRAAAALGVLGRIGDPERAADVAACLGSETASVRASAARALAALGDPDGLLPPALAAADDALAGVILHALARDGGAPTVAALVSMAEERAASSEPATRAAALLFLAARAPERAEGPLTLGLSDVPEVRAAVRDALDASSEPALVAVARALALASEPGSTAHAAAIDFLARARSGAGLDALVDLEASPLALALALGRAPGAAGRARALAALVERSPASLRDVYATLAGAPRAPAPPPDGDAMGRAAAAACAWLSPRTDTEALRAALVAEDDARAFAWLARAAVAHGVAVPGEALAAWLGQDQRRADALALVPAALAAARPRDARAMRRALSTGLRDDDPRVRATAAQALGAIGARESAAALEGLLDDPALTVRVAAARALSALEPALAIERVLAEARAAHAPASAAALVGALKPIVRAETLAVTIERRDASTATPWVDVRTCDGAWLRLPALEGGLVVVPDVPCAQADVDLVLVP